MPHDPKTLQLRVDEILSSPLVQDTVLPFMQKRGFIQDLPTVEISQQEGNAVRAQAFPEENRIVIAADADLTPEELEGVVLHELGHFVPEGKKEDGGEQVADDFRDAVRFLRGDEVEFSPGMGEFVRGLHEILRGEN